MDAVGVGVEVIVAIETAQVETTEVATAKVETEVAESVTNHANL